MRSIWEITGKAAFWATWPGIYLFLKFSVRTRLLVTCGEEILLVKSWLGSGLWSLPGGGLHFREQVLSGAARELREETGLKVAASQFRLLGDRKYADHGLSYTAHVVAVKLPQKPPVTPQRFEILEAKWFSIRDLGRLPHYGHIDDVLKISR